jgi:hypothetical protein
MDAWWSGLIDAVFERTMGKDLLTTLKPVEVQGHRPR